MKLAADCQHCGREFLRPMNFAGVMDFCSSLCRTAKLRNAGNRIINRRVAEIGQCERCSSKRKLHGHHKIPRCVAPLLTADPHNIEVLCELCHGIEHSDLPLTKRWRAAAQH